MQMQLVTPQVRPLVGWRDRPLFVFDTETTGTDPAEARICELGAAHFAPDGQVTRLRQRINPGCPIPAEATQVHNITDADVAGEPSFAQVAPRFLAHLDRLPRLAGFNALTYDVPILNAEMERAGVPARIDPAQVLDVLVFIRWHRRDLRKRTLEACTVEYAIRLDQAHSAAADAQATGELLLHLVQLGIIPADPAQALAEQARLLPLLAEESDRWSYWLYRDRRDPDKLRMGCGKLCGLPLDNVEPGYLRYLVDKLEGLPADVVRIFRARLKGEVAHV